MYGIGAFDGNAGVAGAKKAKSMGWHTQDKAIIGGGNWIYDNYVNVGQDTLYKMKWNVEGFEKKGTISHQYATHIKDSFIKASNFAKGLKNVDAPLVFRIPVYNNMPSKLSEEPKTAQSRK
ncbi:Bifunctional autolysin precursor [compost metagenome]